MEIVKNPIIIGIFAGACTYAYLQWDINEKNKKRKHKKGSKKDKEEVNLLIPLVVSIIAWFIAYAYFEYKPESNENTDIVIPDLYTRPRPPLPLPITNGPGYKFVKDVVSESSEPRSFSLLTGGVTVPTKFPDVLLDMY